MAYHLLRDRPSHRSRHGVARANTETAQSQHTPSPQPNIEILHVSPPSRVPRYTSFDPRTQFIVHPQVQNTTRPGRSSTSPTFAAIDPYQAYHSQDNRRSSQHELRPGNYNTRSFLTPECIETQYDTDNDYNDTVAVWPVVPGHRRTNPPSFHTEFEIETSLTQDYPSRPRNRSTPPHYPSPTHNHVTHRAHLQASVEDRQSEQKQTCAACNDSQRLLEGYDRILGVIVDLCELQRGELREILDLEEEEMGGDVERDGDEEGDGGEEVL
jgi:hypothetical protein